MLKRKFLFYFNYLREYGLKCLIAVVLSAIFPYDNNGSAFSWWILRKKHKVLLQYLSKHYYSEVEGEKKKNEVNKEYKNCIWTAWLQGEENAPEVIQLTLASIRHNANGHKVIVLTEGTINKYIDIPQEIQEKHKNKIIGYAHYADIVRMMILARYGGIWLDATMLLNYPINEKAFLQPFYSVRFKPYRSSFVSEQRWILGVIGGDRESEFLPQISSMLTKYWLEHDICIDYLVFDYMITILYNHKESFRLIINELSRMEYLSKTLREIINEPYQKDVLDRLLAKNLVFYLTYRYDYRKTTSDGKETNYGHLCTKFLA